MAVEVKALRASFLKQGKSPNEFGFSQASQLWALGFPRVAVAHLIVSDESPPEAWREISIFEVMDRDGRVEPRANRLHDMMPADLINRAFGRLVNRSLDERTGLVAAYVGTNETLISQSYKEEGVWIPFCRKPLHNDQFSVNLMESVADFSIKIPVGF